MQTMTLHIAALPALSINTRKFERRSVTAAAVNTSRLRAVHSQVFKHHPKIFGGLEHTIRSKGVFGAGTYSARNMSRRRLTGSS